MESRFKPHLTSKPDYARVIPPETEAKENLHLDVHRFTHSNTLFVNNVVFLIHLLIPQLSMEHIDR